MVLSIEERVFLVEYIFWEGNRYTDLGQEQFAEKFPETPPDFYLWGGGGGQQNLQYVVIAYVRVMNKSEITVYIRNIIQAYLQKVFANEIKQVQACMGARGHHFQHLL